MTMALDDVQYLTLAELRKLAMQESKARGIGSSWVQSAKRETLISWLSGQSDTTSEHVAATPGNDLASMIAAAVAPLVKAQAPDFEAMKADIAAMVDSKLAAIPNRTIDVTRADAPTVRIKGAHKDLPRLLDVLAVGCHAWLVGPSGTGKTTLASHAAEALALNYYCLSVCQQTTESALIGYMDATGKYVRTMFREAYEHGGLFCLDEVDAGSPNVLLVLNAALSNGHCAFRDGMVKRHENFRLVACANTFGQGASAQYSGRCKIDAATLDRFVNLEIGYDLEMEVSLTDNKQWLARCHAVRNAADKLKIHAVVSPRAIKAGSALLARGWNREAVEAAVLFKGLSADAVAKLQSEASNG